MSWRDLPIQTTQKEDVHCPNLDVMDTLTAQTGRHHHSQLAKFCFWSLTSIWKSHTCTWKKAVSQVCLQETYIFGRYRGTSTFPLGYDGHPSRYGPKDATIVNWPNSAWPNSNKQTYMYSEILYCAWTKAVSLLCVSSRHIRITKKGTSTVSTRVWWTHIQARTGRHHHGQSAKFCFDL